MMYCVAHLLASNFFGGPEKQIVMHARLLDKERFRFAPISFVEYGQPNGFLLHSRQAGLDVVELPSRHAFDLGVVQKLKGFLRDSSVHLLCAHGYKANVVGRLASWQAGIPHFAVSRGWTGENRKIRCYEWLDRLFLRLADHVVAVSDGQRQKVLRLGIDPRRVTVVRNAIDLSVVDARSVGSFVRQQLGIPQDALWVASAGRLSPEKNQRAMIEVARQVCAKDRKVYFTVFGEGFLRGELSAAIDRAGLEGRFFLPGFNKDILAAMKEIDIFMLPSFTEGLPNVVLEAFACKKPVVATAVGGTPEVVQHDVSGFLTSPNDVIAMVEALGKLLADSELRQRMGNAGYQFVEANFDSAAQTAAYEQLYTEVLQKRGSGR